MTHLIGYTSSKFLLVLLMKSSRSVYKSLSYLTGYDNLTLNKSNISDIKCIEDEIMTSDINYMVNVVKMLLEENLTLKNNLLKNNSLNISIIGLKESLNSIEISLNSVQSAIKIHEQKYFNSWRQFDCETDLANIKTNIKIFRNRYKIFIDLLNLKCQI